MHEEQAVEEQSAATTSVQVEAEADEIVHTYRNKATGNCLDDSGAGLRAYPCNGLENQQWVITELGNNVRILRNKATGRCLDDSFELKLRTHECNGQVYQRWIVDRDARGLRYRNEATGNCLDDSEEGLFTKTPNNTLHQRWV